MTAPLSSTQILTPAENSRRFNEVLTTIGRTQKMMVLCGEDVCLAEGLLVACELTLVRAERRTRFLQHLAWIIVGVFTKNNSCGKSPVGQAGGAELCRLFDEGRLVRYLTESFDGVEERCWPGFSDRVTMLYGDNRQLCCCTTRCRKTSVSEARKWDDLFLEGVTVICPDCNRANTKTSKQRRTGTDATRALRPTVQLALGADILLGPEREALKAAAETCQLLLIIGTSLKDVDILDLTRELGEIIHSKYGAVVYVNSRSLRGGRSTYDHIDFHLLAEPEVVVDGILFALDEANNESVLVDGGDHMADMWFDQEEPKRTLESIRANFLCPDCWEFESAGLYPHFVRAFSRLTIEESGVPLPRMVILLFYLEQFWPVTKQLSAALGGRWKNNGWPCHVILIKLESLADRVNTIDNLTWEEKSFDVMVIYLTHGLSHELGYQIGHGQSYQGAQFLDLTLKLWRGLLNSARTKRAFFLCCGHPLLSPRMVQEMQTWINSMGTLDSITGCLNRKMSPGFMVNMMASMSTRLVEKSDWAWETMFEVWLTDSIARTHSDLLYLAPSRPAEMWLYAPFQSRPLGKPLPDLLQVCHCSKLEGSSASSDGTVGRKQWKVTHEGKGGQPISQIKVKAACSRCKQHWQLPSADMVGDLKNMGGQYGVRIPYFISKPDN
ncbi:alpha-mannosidase [Rhizoctonia solani]|uniref:Alpha-mannosidase n=1 Tax=Rhizoctonia solani TaxID=456999 RepID=A0A0K6G3K6_9AGAM|nr:alpha-mannosidase [Rhizoctonia solani]